MKLLIVRPQPGADATAKRVRQAGYVPLLMPLFDIEPVNWELPDPAVFDAMLLTSSNAVRTAAAQLRDMQKMPIYAVGLVTASALEDTGLAAFATGASGVEELVGLAKANGHRDLLWLAGEDRTEFDPPDGVTIEVRTVYRSAAIDAPAEFADSVTQAGAVLLHSARAARHFSDLCITHDIDRSEVAIAALSANIATAAGSGWSGVLIAAEPNDASLLSVVQRRFTTASRDP